MVARREDIWFSEWRFSSWELSSSFWRCVVLLRRIAISFLLFSSRVMRLVLAWISSASTFWSFTERSYSWLLRVEFIVLSFSSSYLYFSVKFLMYTSVFRSLLLLSELRLLNSRIWSKRSIFYVFNEEQAFLKSNNSFDIFSFTFVKFSISCLSSDRLASNSMFFRDKHLFLYSSSLIVFLVELFNYSTSLIKSIWFWVLIFNYFYNLLMTVTFSSRSVWLSLNYSNIFYLLAL